MDSNRILRADIIICVRFITLIALLASGSARAQGSTTLYVANNSVSFGPACGSFESPCRSISQAIRNAADGNLIEVGPGIYGDIDGNGDATGPGEEPEVTIDKAVTVYSQAGAAVTTIRAPLNPAAENEYRKDLFQSRRARPAEWWLHNRR